jgi:hypothetical protein
VNGSIGTFLKLIHGDCVAELRAELADDRRNNWLQVAAATDKPVFPMLRDHTCIVKGKQVLGLTSVVTSGVDRHHDWSAEDDEPVVDRGAPAAHATSVFARLLI